MRPKPSTMKTNKLFGKSSGSRGSYEEMLKVDVSCSSFSMTQVCHCEVDVWLQSEGSLTDVSECKSAPLYWEHRQHETCWRTQFTVMLVSGSEIH